ncbi:hypothetical protein EJ04DRAFT_539643 [Polyplosphaeria fusca]|uniref:Uncharacterized protein n=1 Tax=Polyplosphaeria fusca TaxID=682080 RepID=A0A9P4R7Y6_9PLEO|nr:hypothetical protein EJ04DRAFT_539643 [Polyplosphaeria fusca]
MSEPGLLARILGRLAYEFNLMQPEIPTYILLLVSAVVPIFMGVHASLSRPSSAAKPSKKKKKKKSASAAQDNEDEDDEEESIKMEGLSPMDAILFPLLAGLTLTGLYFLIKWLDDPAILNKWMNWYFAIFGVFSVATLITDALDTGHSILFPRRYALGGALYCIDAKKRKAFPVAGRVQGKAPITSPLPGFLARIPLSEGLRKMLWSDRAMPHKKWTVRLYLHRIFAGKARIGPHAVAGFVLSFAAVAYFNFVDKPWYLTNLIGFGFCYTSLTLMSPTTFVTGSLILGALFFYDIYFVFFTPIMVTVAKSLDVPIKLVFPRPLPPDAPEKATPSFAMLGLGDIVLPGIMIGLALRFDLYLFYLRKQIVKPNPSKHNNQELVKMKYSSLAGRWGDFFWCHSILGYPLFSASASDRPMRPFTFPKVYFTASMIGYVLGLLTTLGVMQVWKAAQPALLYLVPGVLGSVWLTALFRGELKPMWNYSEADDEEEKSDDKQDTPNPAPRRSSTDPSSGAAKKSMTPSYGGLFSPESSEDSKVKKVADHRSDRELFSFSVEAPWKLIRPHSIRKSTTDTSKTDKTAQDKSPLDVGKPNWAPLQVGNVDESAGKRIRLN